jgi:hypothetical protein
VQSGDGVGICRNRREQPGWIRDVVEEAILLEPAILSFEYHFGLSIDAQVARGNHLVEQSTARRLVFMKKEREILGRLCNLIALELVYITVTPGR